MVLTQFLVELNNYKGAFGETTWSKTQNIQRVIC